MKSSEAGKVERVNVLLVRGARVNMQNKVSDVIIHCVHAMQHVDDDVYARLVYV